MELKASFEDLLLLRGSNIVSKKTIRLKKIKHDLDDNAIVALYTPKTKYTKISIDKNTNFNFVNLERATSSVYYDHNYDRMILVLTNPVRNYIIIFKSIESILKCFKFENKLPNNPVELFQYENSTISGLI